MGNTELNESSMNRHNKPILLMYLLISKFRFLEFRLLLSHVDLYSSLPRTIWYDYLNLLKTKQSVHGFKEKE